MAYLEIPHQLISREFAGWKGDVSHGGGQKGHRTCEESGGYRFLVLLREATAVEEEWVADIAHGGRERGYACGGDGGGRRLRWAGNTVN